MTKQGKKQTKLIFGTVLLLLFGIMLPTVLVRAEENEKVIPVTEDGGSYELITGEKGRFEVPESVTYYDEAIPVSYATFSSDNPDILTVDENGTFSALASGYVEVVVSVYGEKSQEEDNGNRDDYDGEDYDGEDSYYNDDDDSDGYYDNDDYYEEDDEYDYLLRTYYEFSISPDLSNVTIDKTSQTLYVSDYSYYWPEFTFKLKSDVSLNDDDDNISVTYTSSNKKISVYGSLENNVITLSPSQAGKTTVTIKINNKTFKVTINMIQVSINKNSLLMSKKQVKQLKLTGVKKGIKWSSSNSKIASVSSTGKVKAKKNGNVVIKAKIGNMAFGCAVSVVSPNRQKAINYAIKIGKTCTYSQPKRMQAKFYDCSSLVWRAYSKYGINFGNAHYAPVAADQGKWCVTHKKIVKGGLSEKNVTKMKLNAGDLMFEESDRKDRYRGIYHVEMIAGYVCYGFDSNGKPILAIAWANRAPGSYGWGGQMVGRP